MMFFFPRTIIIIISGILLVLSLPAVESYNCTNGINVNYFNGPFTLFLGDIPSQQLNVWICTYTNDLSASVEWYHNGTLLQPHNTPGNNYYYWSPISNVSQSGTYSCVVVTQSGEQCGNKSVSLYVIDQSQVHIPTHQYSFLNHSYTLQASSSVYPIDSISWFIDELSNTSIVTNEFNSVQLSDESLYLANVTLLGVWRIFNTTLHVLISPVIQSHPQPHVAAYGPNITNYTISFINYSPGPPNITWSRNGVHVPSTNIINTISTYGGTSVLQVSRRSDSGHYTVTIQSTFNNLPVPNDVMETTKDSYSFLIDVFVYPALPVLSISSGTHSGTVSWSHTNVSADHAPQSIKLTLLQSLVTVTMANISALSTNSHTFTELIPATSYTVRSLVANIDGISAPSTVDFTTKTASPYIQSFTAVRTNSTTFNITLQFLYYGSTDITGINLGYKPVDILTVSFNFMTIPQWNSSGLVKTFLITINNNDMIVRERIQFMVRVTNSDDKSVTSDIVQEMIDPLGPASSVSFSSVTAHTVTLKLRLPVIGTPPILSIMIMFTSSRGNHTHTINGLYQLGEELTISINETLEEAGLYSGTRYTVWAVASNLLGYTNMTSNRVSFVTVVEEPLPSSTTPTSQSVFPLWAICVVGVLPALMCVLIIVALTSITLCSKKRGTKKGYPINTSTEKTAPYNEDSVGIQKYFSTPLVPRAPTTEPSLDLTTPLDMTNQLDMTSYHSAQEDSDSSDTTQSLSPKYKYVVSPTPSEIGIKGYVGSAPGSGTYVYV